MMQLVKRSIALGKLVRYSAVSVIATTTSLLMLGLLVAGVGVGATVANLLATACGTVPSFELNRRWVWLQKGKGEFWRQFVPFCGLTVAGLLLSTLTVHVAALHTATWSRAPHTLAVELANVIAYGTVWIVQFFVLDRLLFAAPLAVPVPEGDRAVDGASEKSSPCDEAVEDGVVVG
jgi:putative flippase GtrA